METTKLNTNVLRYDGFCCKTKLSLSHPEPGAGLKKPKAGDREVVSQSVILLSALKPETMSSEQISLLRRSVA